MSSPGSKARLALVTGVGRRAGIGAAVALRLAQDGWDVAVTYWQPYDARMPWGADDAGRQDVVEEIRRLGTWAGSFPANLETVTEVSALFGAVTSEAGRAPSALVMCHGESVESGLLDTTVESFDRHYAVNVRASWLLAREFVLHCPPSEAGGRIVAMTSDHTVGNLPYGATKGALDRMIIAAATELGGRGITANVINPGPTDTGWMSSEIRRQVVADTPLQRLGQPSDAASLVAFLCSPEGGWINGQLLCSNGGFSG